MLERVSPRVTPYSAIWLLQFPPNSNRSWEFSLFCCHSVHSTNAELLSQVPVCLLEKACWMLDSCRKRVIIHGQLQTAWYPADCPLLGIKCLSSDMACLSLWRTAEINNQVFTIVWHLLTSTRHGGYVHLRYYVNLQQPNGESTICKMMQLSRAY